MSLPKRRIASCVGEARERRDDLQVGPHLAHQRREQLLEELEDVFLRREAHLQVELRELGLAVGAQVLVAQAARDLEVALEAGDHQELLVLLRRLRQRVEACRGWRRLGTRKSRAPSGVLLVRIGVSISTKPRSDEEAPDERRSTWWRTRRLLRHPLAAQVQVAVAQAEQLLHLGLLVDREGRRARRR